MSGISPVRVGQTDPSAHLHFVDDLGKPFPLPTGTTFLAFLYDTRALTTKVGQGTFTATNLAQGLVDYNWSAIDTAVAGTYKFYAQYTLPSGGVGYGDQLDFIVGTPL